jgi:hypothetical protein
MVSDFVLVSSAVLALAPENPMTALASAWASRHYGIDVPSVASWSRVLQFWFLVIATGFIEKLL